MADGSELIRPYQYGFKDLVFGSDTPFITEKVEGLLSLPSVDVRDIDNEADHGTFSGAILMREREVEFDIKILGQIGTDIEQKLALARRTFQMPRKRLARTSEPFTFWRPGEPKKMIWARCTRREFDSDYETARGLASGSVRLHASDPLIYSAEEHSQTVTLVDAATVGAMTVYQDGDYVDGAYPVLTITGPATDPIITNDTDDARAVRLEIAMGAGDTVVVDVKNEIAYLNGVRNSAMIRSDNQWWALLPGENEITYSRSAGSISSDLTITYRDAWQ